MTPLHAYRISFFKPFVKRQAHRLFWGGLLLVFACNASPHVLARPLAQNPNPLLAIYILALDSDLAVYEADLLSNIQAGTSGQAGKVAVVLVDGNHAGDTHIVVVNNGVILPIPGLPDANGALTTTLNEYDMADGATIGGFLKWARQTYAAPKTILTLVGHGLPLAPITDMDSLFKPAVNAALASGNTTSIPLPSKYWASPSYSDSHPNRTVFTPKQLGVALALATDNGRNPITVLDLVHCFGATIEELYEVAPYAATTVASPSYTYLVPEALKFGLLYLSTTATAIDMARLLADRHNVQFQNHPYIITAIDNSHLEAVKNAWNGVATNLKQQLGQNAAARATFSNALAQAKKYDAPVCASDWVIDNADYLVDLGSLARQLQNAFPGTAIATSAGQMLNELQAALFLTGMRADNPWMRLDQFWNFDSSYAGVAIYANFTANWDNNLPYLSFQASYYDSDASVVPYRFIQRTSPNVATWADVFKTFWQGQTVKTAVCLPGLQITNGATTDLNLNLRAQTAPAALQTNFAYTLTVNNNTPTVATGVVVAVNLPLTVTLISAGNGCVANNGLLTCSLGAIAAGGSAHANVVIKPTSLGKLNLIGQVTSSTWETNLTNNRASLTITMSGATTPTPPPASTPSPTSTPRPTNTPTPTATATRAPATATPTATRSPVPPTPTATPTPNRAACTVNYTISNDWKTGFVVNSLTLTNNGPALTNWIVTWHFAGNQQITNLWNGVLTQTGNLVKVQNATWNGAVTRNGSVSFGFQANYSGANAKPTDFALNGVACPTVQGAQVEDTAQVVQIFLPVVMR
ncbi:MAG: cellulose binding domain-containing protein [Caldilineaceae bacterium]